VLDGISYYVSRGAASGCMVGACGLFTIVTLLVLTVMWLAGTEHLRTSAFETGDFLWWAVQTGSEVLETGLEFAGFVVGRAVARVGSGFIKGYNV
jgi:hypothetical protein